MMSQLQEGRPQHDLRGIEVAEHLNQSISLYQYFQYVFLGASAVVNANLRLVNASFQSEQAPIHPAEEHSSMQP